MTRATAVLLLTAALAAGCRERAASPPRPAATADPGKLRPLTSRDGAQHTFAPEPLASLPPGHPPVDGAPAPAGPRTGDAVSGTVVLAPMLKARLGPTDALFVIARSAATRQILAVRKAESVRFPFAFEISGADAMVEGTPFVGPFDITARLSKSGDAMPGGGDVEGTAKGVAAGAKNVVVTLDTVRQ